jgi:transposase
MYSIDLRKLSIHTYSLLNSLRKTSKVINVSHTTISRWLKNINKKKYNVNIEKTKTYKVKEILKTTIECNPFISLRQLKDIIKSTLSLSVSIELLRVAMKIHGYSKKKVKYFSKSSGQELKTKEFLKKRSEFIKQNKYFVSIDKTSFGRNGILQYGYSPIGVPLKIQKLQPRITTQSYLVACDNKSIIKKVSKNGSVNTEYFLNFLKDLKLPNNTVILLDNVSFHHSKVVKDFAKESNIELLYTPPYSPWFNPIEEVFSIVKRLYYQNNPISNCFNNVKEFHCNSFFKHSFSIL